ncbi:MAG: type VI secretion system tube protein Hcp [Planctomycetota bacterium]
MKTFMRIEGIPGQATDKDHKDWILVSSVSSPIHRVIKEGAVDVERTQGTTTLGNLFTTRRVDKSTVKLAEACAKGKYIPEVEIHLCNVQNEKVIPFLKYKLFNVIITEHTIDGESESNKGAHEAVAYNFEKIDWTFTVIDPKDGSEQGEIIAQYNPGEG